MENGINSIIVYGDSILKGAITGTGDKRFEIIEENSLALVAKTLNLSITNKSVFGNIITKERRTLEHDLEKGMTFDAAIVESGGNDCDRDWVSLSKDPTQPVDHRTPLPIFIESIDFMISSLRKVKITPILMTMPPLVADRYFKNICISGNEKVISDFIGGDIIQLYRMHELYNMAITDYAKTHNVQLVDMRREFLMNEYALSESYRADPSKRPADSKSINWSELMCADGIHPNRAGYAFMAKIWERELPKIKKEF